MAAYFTLFVLRLITKSADTDRNSFAIPENITNQTTEGMKK